MSETNDDVRAQKGGAASGENFILPQTEASLQKIIGGVQAFFVWSRMGLYALYFVWALCRVFIYRNFLELNAIIAAAAFALALLYFLENLLGVRFSRAASAALKIVWRLASLCMAVFLFKGLLDFAAGKDGGTSERVFAFEIVFTVLFLLGWTLSILGDVFNLTVPVWAEQILQSFKRDIEPSGLARRSIKKVEEASGKVLRKAGPKIAAGVGASTIALGLAMLRRALRGK